MAYTWTTGETITAEKLNNTGGGVLIVNETMDQSTLTGHLDKTWKEIHDAYINGVQILLRSAVGLETEGETYGSLSQITNAGETAKPFSVTFSLNEYSSETEDGYPSTGSGPM